MSLLRKPINTVTILRYNGVNNYPLLAQLPEYARKAALSRIFYSNKARFFYARIPKNANSTLVRTFAHHLGYQTDSDSTGKSAKKEFNVYPTVAQYDSSFRVIAFRDHIIRVLSAWLDKGHNGIWIKKRRFCGDETTIPTIEQFLTSLEANNFYSDGHFIPQTSLIPGSINDYRIVTIENLSTSLPGLCEEAFGAWSGIKVKSTDRTRADLIAENIESSTRHRIAHIYRDDMEVYASLAS